MSSRVGRHASFLGLVAGPLFLLAAGTPAKAAQTPAQPSNVCNALRPFSRGNDDAASVLQHCLDSAKPGETVALPAGTYLMRIPIFIRASLSLTTAGVPSDAPACRRVDTRCATLMPMMSESAIAQAPMPINVQADGVTVDHLIFAGTRVTAPRDAQALCLSQHGRSLAGGIRWSGQASRITRSVFRDFACYSALEVGTGSGLIADNLFSDNGTHTVNMMWSDGLTVHEGKSLNIRDNIFVDNTDVQLIFGGCTSCKVVGNRFRHSARASGGSFAELMIHAWPGGATSGRYDLSMFANNDIDCGTGHQCGFGIMVGALPWYQAPTSGGTVQGNRVRNAMLGLNVDGLSGPVAIGANQIETVAGRYVTTCGSRQIDRGVNIAPSSRRFVTNAQTMQTASAQSFVNCLLNYPAFPK